jgi:ABC-type Zn uptake system ZnuABC Zn-binding protein ZnuA
VGAALPSPAGEASPRNLAHLLAAIRQEGIPAVFVEPQFNADLLESLADEAGVRLCTLYSDTLDDRVPTYVEMMRFNANELVRRLGGTGGG